MADLEPLPIERLAAAFEKIAEQLDDIKYKIDGHAESIDYVGREVSSSLDRVARAIRGVEDPKED